MDSNSSIPAFITSYCISDTWAIVSNNSGIKGGLYSKDAFAFGVCYGVPKLANMARMYKRKPHARIGLHPLCRGWHPEHLLLYFCGAGCRTTWAILLQIEQARKIKEMCKLLCGHQSVFVRYCISVLCP